MENDYISRRALIEEMCKGCCGECNLDDSSCITVDMVLQAPAADVAPVVHARWEERDAISTFCGVTVKTGTYTACSACGTEAETLQSGGGCYLTSDYCHHCGAKMDAEADAE